MNRKELQELARQRLREARMLLRRGSFDGAYYLGGYVVECGLKACIAKKVRRHDFPDRKIVEKSYTHNLDELVKVAGLDLGKESQNDPVFERNWAVVKDWTEGSRYQRHGDAKAKDLYSAIADKKHGVLRWIRKHW